LPLKFLAVLAALVTLVGVLAARSPGAIDVSASKIVCDKYASPLGSNAFSGTLSQPFATVDKLANSLRPGRAGCLRAGVYQRDVKIIKGGTTGSPTVITSAPGERATVVGRFHVADEANNVVVQQLDLDGRNQDNLPSPTINGDNVTFRDNDVTNHHTSICFLLGSIEYGRARNAVLERNRIHNCGLLPPTNHHHGIYIEASDNARIIDNWIYDNADRGIQMFPDAQRTYIEGNVIDGNGQGVVFSRKSSNNLVEHNVIANSIGRYNIEDWELTGNGNLARRNCVWSPRDARNAGGIQPDLEVPAVDNIVTDPEYIGRDRKDFRLRPDSPCNDFSLAAKPQASGPRKKRGREVLFDARAASIWPGGRLRLQAKVMLADPQPTVARSALVMVRRDGAWVRAGALRLHGSRYVGALRYGERARNNARLFGQARIPHGRSALRLRAFVRGVGRSNIVVVRVRP
jgi:hypothetical protein